MDQVIIQNVHMNGGTAETSYSANSSVQNRGILITRPIVEEAVLNILPKLYNGNYICATNSKLRKITIGIADFGCSSGPNALLAVSQILETIYNNRCEFGSVTPEILVFLNDLPGNDFNYLFKDVVSFCGELKRTKGDGFGPCFVAGIPGTFYGRLFPSDSLHIVHSSYSLHWLSQVPQGIEKTNKGNFYIAKSSSPSAITAYLNQFKKDFRVFLECRSDELVDGGRMVLTLLGRISSDPTSKDCCSFWELLALSARDMVLQGAIEEEKFNLFNIPHYYPSPEEVKLVIQSEGSFTIKHLETFHVNWDGSDPNGDEDSETDKLSSHDIAKIVRAVSEPLLANHFGQEMMDRLYARLGERIAEYASKEKTELTNIVISMTKVEKSNS
ncbi:hypothetical protein MKW94_001067 [Papaver nudicaule]|uniref:Uncharacterized protein n=1 Tax=Papaver nudicaule TaxID=74823 RepID=A0AA41VYL1_PAPNU|nr:hypothetical protein [Papaver nudicaule]